MYRLVIRELIESYFKKLKTTAEYRCSTLVFYNLVLLLIIAGIGAPVAFILPPSQEMHNNLFKKMRLLQHYRQQRSAH
jgi:hypothetical protein